MENFDILIINQGISGLALACGLNDYFRIAIIEHRNHSNISETDQQNITTSLVNITSLKILQYLKIWSQDIAHFSSLLDKLEILKKNNIKKTVFNSGYLGYLELGYIIDDCLIYQALVNRARQLRNIIFIDSNSPNTISYHEDFALITVNNNYILKAKLVIGADGVDSLIRKNTNIALLFKDTKYYGLTTSICTEQSHKNTLRFIIHNDGLLILLPLKNTHLSVVFWLLPPHAAKKYLYVSNPAQRINYDLIKICNILGQCIIHDNTKHKIFIPRIQYAHNFIKHRLILLGKSAYLACPLFFQNINLELMDTAILLNYLKKLRKNNKDIGRYDYLKCYERSIKYRITKNLINIPYIHMLLHDKNYFLEYVQYFIFYLINTIPNSKIRILRYIMGLDDLPKWLLRDRYD
ncbi:FAD-dependent monooxygenase [Blochmannia endosymbiont of Camponotus sp.]|uniref:FAD-dependent monooxygenase n=1 Tax=Blochmannia endosymbiont of Camponotus sp. TaxID=700220 RepID=UPI0020246882|nr:FAD-dependent monooxygenase [Blochmannia endosymbiont of Camponotus sp.]URJ30988.1 FAD-dependent monooxygenase [Blochmannia endosymbiont of Camponotus sp.]